MRISFSTGKFASTFFAAVAVLIVPISNIGSVPLAAQTLTPGNVVVSRSEYQGSAGTVTAGQ